jgi:hypothetical protein
VTTLQADILETIEAGGDLVKAIRSCALLLKTCHCQNERRAEAERALCTTNSALDRWGLALSNLGNTASRIKRNAKCAPSK